MSHLEYFRSKNVILQHPDAKPMIKVKGRRQNQDIFLPPELVTSVELEPRVREMLPLIASYKPDKRFDALQKIKQFLTPGAQTTRGREGLLPSLGVRLKDGKRRWSGPLCFLLNPVSHIPFRDQRAAHCCSKASSGASAGRSRSLDTREKRQ